MTSSTMPSSTLDDPHPFWRGLLHTSLGYLAWGYGALLLSFLLYGSVISSRWMRANHPLPLMLLAVAVGGCLLIVLWRVCAKTLAAADLELLSFVDPRPSAIYVPQNRGIAAIWRITSRLVDIVVSATVLAALAPLWIVIAAAIRFTSDGPIFHRQTRLGASERRFTLYKFRTMIADTSRMLQPLQYGHATGGRMFKLKNDPRITPVGRFLRKTNLHLLPRLINVLLGDVSLASLWVRREHSFSYDPASGIAPEGEVKPEDAGQAKASPLLPHPERGHN